MITYLDVAKKLDLGAVVSLGKPTLKDDPTGVLEHLYAIARKAGLK
jgi:hypothetical protein